MGIAILQILLISLVLFTYLMLAQAIELFGITQAWSTTGLSVVAGVLWYFLLGKTSQITRRMYGMR